MEKFISAEIGDEYKEWMIKNLVFLTAPTGSGKTTFVLDKLVEYAESRNAKILYLVNRKILKAQIESIIDREIRYKVEDIKEVIEVKTYQELEAEHPNGMENPELLAYAEAAGELEYWKGERPQHKIIIADECHYFFSDSTYNPHTFISYDWIMYYRRWSILVFMSATIDKIKEYILKDIGYEIPDPKPVQSLEQTQPVQKGLKVTIEYPNDRIRQGSLCVKEYGAQADYSCVDLHILEDIDSIADVIKEKKQKWLIFVDSIKKGESIHHSLLDSEIDSVFIDAKWTDDNDEKVFDTIETMVREQDFKQQVVVATSVIDNGVSIKNVGLRNLVIMADTKEQFIQMLGRKRLDYDTDKKNERINLYILKRKKSYFEKRLRDVERDIEYIGKYYDAKDDFKSVLKKIQRSPNWYRCFRRICHIKDNSVILNRFSDKQYQYLRNNYASILKRFDKEDDYAFVRQQAKWIGKEVEDIVSKYKQTLEDKVGKIIDEYVDKKLDKEKNTELRERIRIDLRTLLTERKDIDQEEEEIRNIIDDLGKKSSKKNIRTFSAERFNSIMELLKMECRMKKENNYNVINYEKLKETMPGSLES